MFKAITDAIEFPFWAREDERYKRLDILDRAQDGTFYDHIPYPFHMEKTPNNQTLLMMERRPSARWALPSMFSNNLARKLFAGRHAPRLVHPDEQVRMKVQAITEESQLETRRLEAAAWGTTGSVAITFKVVDDHGVPRMCSSAWRAKWCIPTKNRFGLLDKLRLQYVTPGYKIMGLGIFTKDAEGKDIDAGSDYWFTRDYTTQYEITYLPVDASRGSRWRIEEKGLLKEDEDLRIEHGLGFVPAHWFKNKGGDDTDGICYWEAAMNNVIEIDYLQSQIGRGIKYSGQPELVIIGKLQNTDDGDITRGNVLEFEAAQKDSEGQAVGGGDAKLLEMTGQGIKAGIELCEVLKRQALQQIGASRKDPEKMAAPTSGKALEVIDEEAIDAVYEQRTVWGEGYLLLLKKVIKTARVANHPLAEGLTDEIIDALTLQWPRAFDPTPQEILQLAQGFTEAVRTGIVDRQQAKAYLAAQVDFPVESANQTIALMPKKEEPKTTPEPINTAELNAGAKNIYIKEDR